jgi:hypothetical protein
VLKQRSDERVYVPQQKQWSQEVSLLIYERTLRPGRDAHAAKWNFRAAVARAIRIAAPAIKEGWEIVLTMAGLLVIVVASLALDVWIWVPRLGH